MTDTRIGSDCKHCRQAIHRDALDRPGALSRWIGMDDRTECAVSALGHHEPVPVEFSGYDHDNPPDGYCESEEA